VEDLVQDTYLKLCSNDFQILRGIRSDHPNGAYALVRAVAHSTTIDYLRKRRNPLNDGQKSVSLDALQVDLALAEPLESQLHRRMLFEQIDAILSRTGPSESRIRDRSVFWLYYRQGYSAKEIAALLAVGLTVKGVESLLFRMTATLRTELSAAGQKGKGDSPRHKGEDG